jgi:AraC-like DNA-binding protein
MVYDRDLLLSDFLQRLKQDPAKSLKSLSREMGVSARTLQNLSLLASGRCFKELQRETLLAIVRGHLLRQPTLSIKELSFCLGYNSPRAFARSVRRASGMSPISLRASVTKQLCTAEMRPLSVTDPPVALRARQIKPVGPA